MVHPRVSSIQLHVFLCSLAAYEMVYYMYIIFHMPKHSSLDVKVPKMLACYTPACKMDVVVIDKVCKPIVRNELNLALSLLSFDSWHFVCNSAYYSVLLIVLPICYS